MTIPQIMLVRDEWNSPRGSRALRQSGLDAPSAKRAGGRRGRELGMTMGHSIKSESRPGRGGWVFTLACLWGY